MSKKKKSAVIVTFIPNSMVMISMTTSETTLTWTDSYFDCDAGSVLRNPDSSLPAASEAILNCWAENDLSLR